MDPDAKEFLERKFEAKQATQQDAMSYASVDAYIQNQLDMVRSGRRHEAQVDAMLQVQYAKCGYPDAYKPPPAEDDPVGSMINCTFNGDEAITKISQAISGGETKPETKPDPTKTDPVVILPPPPPRKGSNVPKWLLPLAGVALGSGLTFAAASYFGSGDDKDTQNQVIAVPYEPTGATPTERDP